MKSDELNEVIAAQLTGFTWSDTAVRTAAETFLRGWRSKETSVMHEGVDALFKCGRAAAAEIAGSGVAEALIKCFVLIDEEHQCVLMTLLCWLAECSREIANHLVDQGVVYLSFAAIRDECNCGVLRMIAALVGHRVIPIPWLIDNNQFTRILIKGMGRPYKCLEVFYAARCFFHLIYQGCFDQRHWRLVADACLTALCSTLKEPERLRVHIVEATATRLSLAGKANWRRTFAEEIKAYRGASRSEARIGQFTYLAEFTEYVVEIMAFIGPRSAGMKLLENRTFLSLHLWLQFLAIFHERPHVRHQCLKTLYQFSRFYTVGDVNRCHTVMVSMAQIIVHADHISDDFGRICAALVLLNIARAGRGLPLEETWAQTVATRSTGLNAYGKETPTIAGVLLEACMAEDVHPVSLIFREQCLRVVLEMFHSMKDAELAQCSLVSIAQLTLSAKSLAYTVDELVAQRGLWELTEFTDEQQAYLREACASFSPTLSEASDQVLQRIYLLSGHAQQSNHVPTNPLDPLLPRELRSTLQAAASSQPGSN